MAGNKELRNIKSRDAALVIICRENRRTKEMLVHSYAHQAFAFKSFLLQFALIDFDDVFQAAP